jgi:DNA-binding NarL/FixJ family response regulator
LDFSYLLQAELELHRPSAYSPFVKIVIVEDHLMIRDVVRKVCSSEFGYTVVGETDSGVQAVEMILKHRPDAVVLDLSLPDMDGFNVADRVLKVIPSLRILMLSSHCDDYTLFRVEKSGVHGFIDKNSNTIEILRDALAAIAPAGSTSRRPSRRPAWRGAPIRVRSSRCSPTGSGRSSR